MPSHRDREAVVKELAVIHTKLDQILRVLNEHGSRVDTPGASASQEISPPGSWSFSPVDDLAGALQPPAFAPAEVRCPRCNGDLVECRAHASEEAAPAFLDYFCLCIDCGHHFALRRPMPVRESA
jgi:hypothetical protein